MNIEDVKQIPIFNPQKTVYGKITVKGGTRRCSR